MATLPIPSATQVESLKKAAQGGQRSIHISRVGPLAGAAAETILENSVPSVIEYLEFSANQIQAQIIISYKRGATYTPVGQIRSDGSAVAGFDIVSIVAQGASLFETIAYDETLNIFKFSLKHPLTFPEGVKVEVKNNVAASSNIACRLYGREM